MIRKGKMRDIPEIQKLVNSFADQGQMLSLSLVDLYDNLRDFFVEEVDGKIAGTAALHLVWDGLAEVRSLAVRKDMQGTGIAQALVKRTLEEAHEFDCKRVFTLTYVPGFFEKMGFSRIDKNELPHKVWADCVRCPKFPDCGEIPLAYDFDVRDFT